MAQTKAQLLAGKSDQSVTFNDVTASSLNGGPFGGRNRIINGDMRIDQRNAGASVTVNQAQIFYGVDRWIAGGITSDGVFTIQQNTSAPAGFNNSTKITVTTADASLAGQTYNFQQRIEGYNIADLGYGTAGAKTITLSFWTRSSITGTHGGALLNSAQNYSYPFSYSISAADTWEYKTITIAGPTAGTWLTDNGSGLTVMFSIGAGSSLKGTAGSWVASQYYSATGAVDLINTLNATFYITGVQLELGSTATPFERRSYGQELALCQRYCYGQNNSAGQAYYYFGPGFFTSSAGQTAFGHTIFPVTMRAKPSATISAANTFFVDPNITNFTTVAFDQAGVNGGVISLSGGSGGGSAPAGGRWLSNNTATAYVIWSAEL